MDITNIVETSNIAFWLKIASVIILPGFLPLTAVGYYYFKREQKRIEVKRILSKLKIDPNFGDIFNTDISALHFAKAVGFATVVSLLGMTVLFHGLEIGFAKQPSLLLGGARLDGTNSITIGSEFHIYQQRALLFVGMAFLGAYLWGMQSIFRRYSMNDLMPGTYYNLTVRMILASTISLLIYHAFDVLGVMQMFNNDAVKGEGGKNSVDRMTASIMPAK